MMSWISPGSKVGEFRIDSEPVKLSELCKLYEQNICGTAEDKNQKFICNRHDIIYDTVLSDRLRIGQIYMNLLSNAVKYTLREERLNWKFMRNHFRIKIRSAWFPLSGITGLE